MSDSTLLTVEHPFRPLLLEGGRQQLGSAAFRWEELGLTVRVVRGRKMRTVDRLFDEVAAALQFPSYFGENKDAFNECIADLDWLPPGTGHVLLILQPEQVLIDEDMSALSWLIDSLGTARPRSGPPVTPPQIRRAALS